MRIVTVSFFLNLITAHIRIFLKSEYGILYIKFSSFSIIFLCLPRHQFEVACHHQGVRERHFGYHKFSRVYVTEIY